MIHQARDASILFESLAHSHHKQLMNNNKRVDAGVGSIEETSTILSRPPPGRRVDGRLRNARLARLSPILSSYSSPIHVLFTRRWGDRVRLITMCLLGSRGELCAGRACCTPCPIRDHLHGLSWKKRSGTLGLCPSDDRYWEQDTESVTYTDVRCVKGSPNAGTMVGPPRPSGGNAAHCAMTSARSDSFRTDEPPPTHPSRR